MTQQKKYRLLTGVCLGLFVLLVTTEVAGRWAEAYEGFQEVLVLESELQSPDDLAARKLELLARKRLLIASATKGQRSFEQNQTGVIEYLNHCAASSGTKYLSLSPLSSEAKGEMIEIAFSITLRGEFHLLGRWLLLVESGSLACDITKVELQLENISNPLLDATIFGRAVIFPKAGT